jgi:hypothetical protein
VAGPRRRPNSSIPSRAERVESQSMRSSLDTRGRGRSRGKSRGRNRGRNRGKSRGLKGRKCKSANRPTACAKVERWIKTEYRVLDRGRRTKDGKIAVQRCKSERSSCGKVERGIKIRVQSAESSTEDGGRKDSRAKVQIGAELLCKSGKVEANQSSECWIEYRGRRTEDGGKVGAWLRRALLG